MSMSSYVLFITDNLNFGRTSTTAAATTTTTTAASTTILCGEICFTLKKKRNLTPLTKMQKNVFF
jgi:hypothetical protein